MSPTWMPSIYGPKVPDKPEMMHLYGVGDHGGGPTRVMLDHADQSGLQKRSFRKCNSVSPASSSATWKRSCPSMQVPTWDGELYFQYHRGVFTTQAETKRRIRRSEENVLNAEKVCFASDSVTRSLPPRRDGVDVEESALRSLPRHHAGLRHCGELSGRSAQSRRCRPRRK